MEDCPGESLEEGENGGAELALLQQGPEQAAEKWGPLELIRKNSRGLNIAKYLLPKYK
jgi:hypothetical protein